MRNPDPVDSGTRSVGIQGDVNHSLIVTGDVLVGELHGRFPEYATRLRNAVLQAQESRIQTNAAAPELEVVEEWLFGSPRPYLLLTTPFAHPQPSILADLAMKLAGVRDAEISPPHVIYYPISARHRTNLFEVFSSVLSHRLASLHGVDPAAFRGNSEETWRGLVADLLGRQLPEGMQLLLALEAIDEAEGWEFGPDLFPLDPPESLRIAISTRLTTEFPTSDARLKQLGWDREGLADVVSMSSARPVVRRHSREDVGGPQILLHSAFTGFDFPDLLTPTVSSDGLRDQLVPHIGEDLARRLTEHREAILVATEEGDFLSQVRAGQHIIEDSGDIPEVIAIGYYVLGEGMRLLADTMMGKERDELQQKALEYYQLALEYSHENPRAMRGVARIEEIRGNLDTALLQFANARALTDRRLAYEPVWNRSAHLAHEILRDTRHYIHCLSLIRATSSTSRWRSQDKSNELARLIAESDRLHREYMPLFARRPIWSHIEWFMGLVFLAQGWASIGETHRQVINLQHALAARRQMLTHEQPLSNVARMNIRWWLGVAKQGGRRRAFQGFHDELDKLEVALETGSTAEILRQMDAIVQSGQPPWHGS